MVVFLNSELFFIFVCLDSCIITNDKSYVTLVMVKNSSTNSRDNPRLYKTGFQYQKRNIKHNKDGGIK